MTHPTDDDLIRRGDAIAALNSVALTYGATWEPHSVRLCKDAMRTIPAAQPSPDVAALVAENEALRDQRDMWMDRTMNELGENLNIRATLARVKGGE